MSRRREAAELAHALALSTQQVRDISDVSPRSLSSENADTTQDSKELELRIVGMGPPTETAGDDVAFFSGRNVDGDATHDDAIQSFSASQHDISIIQGSSDPFPIGIQQAGLGPTHSSGPNFSPAFTHLSATRQTPGSSSNRPRLSPTQTSDALTRPVVTYQRNRDFERTPLGRKDTNKDVQLSSSPPPPDVERKITSNPSSEFEIVEVVEVDRVRSESGSSSRARLRPEIVLSSKKQLLTRHDSPDPLDSFHMANQNQLNSGIASSSMPSSAGPSNSLEDNGRRSGRVKAAMEKKEAEKEERRRLRRERKAKEAEEKQTTVDLSTSDRPSKRMTPHKSAVVYEEGIALSEVPQSASTTLVTPIAAKRKTPVSKRSEKADKKRSRRSVRDEANAEPASELNIPSSEQVTTGSIDERTDLLLLDRVDAEITVFDAPGAEESVTEVPVAITETASVDVIDEEPREIPNPTMSRLEKSSPDARPESSTSRSTNLSIRARTPLSPPTRHSPGPQGPSGSLARPGGIKWQTPRSDLNSVLSKFPGSRLTGMSKRHRIAPLHAKIGPPVKALPPAPQKPVKKKKGEEDEEEEDSEDGDDGNSGDEEGGKKKNKAKGIEWFMVED